MPPKRRETRVRRSPEEARAHILDAAERVFAEHLPDVVGLKDVAREAGVSHALVTHYFGTYTALVEAALQRRFERLRDRLMGDLAALFEGKPDVAAILAAYRRGIAAAAGDPVTARLATWAVLSGRAAADDFFSHRLQGLKLLADALAARSSLPREDLEFCIVASFAMAITSQLGRQAIAGGLGVRSIDGLEERTTEMIDAFLRRRERAARR
jgi:AcrR family transcriptional regulator